MTLRQKQSKFAYLLTILIQFAYVQGFEITLGDAARIDRKGHCKNSFHYKRLAIDLNLFLNGKYLINTLDYEILGKFWKSLDENCTWGGDFKNKDGNHFSYGEK